MSCGFAVVLLFSGLAGAAPQSYPPPGTVVFSKQIGDGGWALFAGRSDGSGAVQITQGPKDDSAQWSPDGRQIVFERSVAEGETSVWIVNADGTGERELENGPYTEHPRWSPNGRWIAYQVQTSESIQHPGRANTTYELWLVRPSGSLPRWLVENGTGVLAKENPRFYVESGAWAWSPDSRRIAFIWPRDPERATDGVQVIDVGTGATRYLGRGADVAWSPDGRRLVVTTNEYGNIGEPECGSVWIVTVESGKRRRLTQSRSNPCDLFPRWSPDGRAIVFQRSGKRVVFMIATPDGTQLRRVAQLRPAAYRWPADCSKLFEYGNPFDAGWVVPDARGGSRFVPAIVSNGDWRCASARAGS